MYHSLDLQQSSLNLGTHASFHSINILAPHRPPLPLRSDAMLSQMFDFSGLRSFLQRGGRGAEMGQRRQLGKMR